MTENLNKMAALKALRSKFETIEKQSIALLKELQQHDSYLASLYVTRIDDLTNMYNNAKTQLSRLGYSELYRLLPDVKIGMLPTIDKVIGLLNKIVVGCRAGYDGIEVLLSQFKIPSELVNQLKGWRQEIDSIEFLDYHIYKNLDEAIKEMEHGHYIASGLISARVVAWMLQQIPPEERDIENKDRKKVETLIEAGVISKDDRDLHAIILRAARLARNYVSHRIDRYPAPEDASSLLGDAIRLAKIYVEFLKTKEGNNFD